MKSLAFLEQVEHKRKVAIYAAEHDGKMRNFAYHEELGECRETLARRRDGRTNSKDHETASGFSPQRCTACESYSARQSEETGQEKTEIGSVS